MKHVPPKRRLSPRSLLRLSDYKRWLRESTGAAERVKKQSAELKRLTP